VFVAFARLPNCAMYSSAILKLTAPIPPDVPIASAICRIAFAFASAIARIAAACPWAVLISDCFSPSDFAIAASRAPCAMLICSWRLPSDVAITARFSRSAVICACIARRISAGGVRSLIS
jgi:hypothetical protein